jgi:hypothetical protein
LFHITATTPSCCSDDDNPRVNAGRVSLGAGNGAGAQLR